MRLVTRTILLLGFLTAAASATPYYVGFEGDRMPEEVPGYVRHFGGGGATRSIETDPNGNNYLVIDSLASQMIYDYAVCPRQMDPYGPEEVFGAEWRLAVVEQYGYYNDVAGFVSDGGNWVAFEYALDHVTSLGDGSWSYPISVGDFHTYRIESPDMETYRLWVDAYLVHAGAWEPGVTYAAGLFGDPSQGAGARSLAKWDYFRFGVVPEPDSVIQILLVCVCAAAHRR
jgi:hypothetical protein